MPLVIWYCSGEKYSSTYRPSTSFTVPSVTSTWFRVLKPISYSLAILFYSTINQWKKSLCKAGISTSFFLSRFARGGHRYLLEIFKLNTKNVVFVVHIPIPSVHSLGDTSASSFHSELPKSYSQSNPIRKTDIVPPPVSFCDWSADLWMLRK